MKLENNKKIQANAQQKVRNYIISQIFRNASESMRIPSHNELGPKLGIARSSVQLALKQLIKEGYLTTKVGIGTFTNPQKNFMNQQVDDRPPIVGIIIGDGRFVYYNYSAWLHYAAIGEALAVRNIVLQPITLESFSDETLLGEITAYNLDGLIWLQPFPERTGVIQKLAELLPVAVSRGRVEHVDCVDVDLFEQGVALGNKMLELGKSRLFISCCLRDNVEKCRGIRIAFERAGRPLTEFSPKSESATNVRHLEQLRQQGVIPDAILLHPEETMRICDFLQKNNIAVPEECLLVSSMFKLFDAPLPVLAQMVNYRKFSEEVVTLLITRMRDRSRPPRHEFPKFDVFQMDSDNLKSAANN